MEWQFLQRVCKCSDDIFLPLEQAIATTFLPALFHQPPPSRSLTALPVKAGGLSLPDPTTTAHWNYNASQQITCEIVKTIRERGTLDLASHRTQIAAAKEFAKQCRQDTHQKVLEDILSTADVKTKRRLERISKTGTWLTVMPSVFTNTILSSGEMRDSLLLRYGMTPANLPKICDGKGCNKRFTIQHALSCACGYLPSQRHNELRDELADLAKAALTPTQVWIEPLIAPQDPSSEDRGDILIRGLFDKGTECIIDVTITDLDCPSSLRQNQEACLKNREQRKKSQYLRPCQEQRRQFVPFVTSVDGLLGNEAKALLRQLATTLSQKWSKPYSQVRNYVNARVSIALVKGTHLCLRGPRIHRREISEQRYEYDTELGHFIQQGYQTFLA